MFPSWRGIHPPEHTHEPSRLEQFQENYIHNYSKLTIFRWMLHVQNWVRQMCFCSVSIPIRILYYIITVTTRLEPTATRSSTAVLLFTTPIMPPVGHLWKVQPNISKSRSKWCFQMSLMQISEVLEVRFPCPQVCAPATSRKIDTCKSFQSGVSALAMFSLSWIC